MFEIIEDPARDFRSLVAETRDCLFGLMRAGGPAYTPFKLAEKLRELTPRFSWDERETENFIRNGVCKFLPYMHELKGKKQNERDVLTLDDVLKINDYGRSELEPLLQKLRATKSVPDIPTALTISAHENELTFSFETAAAAELMYDRRFNLHILQELERVTRLYLEQKAAQGDKKPDPAPL